MPATPKPATKEQLEKMFPLEVTFKAKGFKTEGPVTATPEGRRSKEQKER